MDRPSSSSTPDKSARLSQLKAKTSCKDCGQRGHWSGDRERQFSRGRDAKKTSFRGAAHVVFTALPRAFVTDGPTMLIDSGCNQSVASCNFLDHFAPNWRGGLNPSIRGSYRFGPGGPHMTLGVIDLAVATGPLVFHIRASAIDQMIPPLFGRDILTAIGAAMCFSRNVLHLRVGETAHEVQLIAIDGHLHIPVDSISVKPFVKQDTVEAIPFDSCHGNHHSAEAGDHSSRPSGGDHGSADRYAHHSRSRSTDSEFQSCEEDNGGNSGLFVGGSPGDSSRGWRASLRLRESVLAPRVRDHEACLRSVQEPRHQHDSAELPLVGSDPLQRVQHSGLEAARHVGDRELWSVPGQPQRLGGEEHRESRLHELDREVFNGGSAIGDSNDGRSGKRRQRRRQRHRSSTALILISEAPMEDFVTVAQQMASHRAPDSNMALRANIMQFVWQLRNSL